METQIDAMQLVIEQLDLRLERVDESIRGNGTTGLTTQLAVLEKRVASCEEFILELRSLRRWLAACILTLFGSLAWRVAEWFLVHQATQ
tara:strand:- start:658 stop:924 length:267 start_codon:yes stop_codon:yes gene_type:complete